MTARPPEEMLSAYLDGEITAEERVLVERELDASAEWRVLLAELRETRQLVQALPRLDAPADFWTEILHERGGSPGDPQDAPVPIDAGRRRRSRVAAWVAGAAAAAAIVAVVLVPGESQVKPRVATLVDSHAARSSVTEEPVSQLAPVATSVEVGR
jgi:anti-sigma factor RsiW